MEQPVILNANLGVCVFGAAAPTMTGLAPWVVAACGGIASAAA